MARVDDVWPQDRHRDRFVRPAAIPGCTRPDTQALLLDLLLHGDNPVQKRLWSGWAAGDVYIDGDILIDPADNIVAFLERPTAGGASAHRQDVFRFRHLVIETHN